jgi:hypothetical protein
MSPWVLGRQSCERCGADLRTSGAHYHCAGCDSLDVTSMLGHYLSAHLVDGKLRKVETHHCTTTKCDLEDK